MRGLLILLLTVWIAAALGAANAQATDESTPPFALPPVAGETPPPVEPQPTAEPHEPGPWAPGAIECTHWYVQTDYAATWPTGSAWWEYRCSPIGLFDQSRAFWTDYYHWTGSDPAFYGRWVFGWYCWCWWDVSAGQWYSPYPSEW